MRPYDENTQTLTAMFDGHDQALMRLEATVKGRDHAHRAVRVAAGEGVEVYEITPSGDVRHADDPQHDRTPDTPDS
jgi:hypothetical protein